MNIKSIRLIAMDSAFYFLEIEIELQPYRRNTENKWRTIEQFPLWFMPNKAITCQSMTANVGSFGVLAHANNW